MRMIEVNILNPDRGGPNRRTVGRALTVAAAARAAAGAARPTVARRARRVGSTDVRMTRFWISLQQGVDFVLRNFKRMRGGEIFVPKIPSVRIVDLATATAPNLPQRVVGIRPREKIHEVMCPSDDSHLMLAFSGHFVIRPTIIFDGGSDYSPDLSGEDRVPVEQGFEYNSGRDTRFLSVPELIEFIQLAGVE